MCRCRIAWSCVFAAIFAVTGDILGLAAHGLYRERISSHYNNWNDFYKLDPALLEEDWAVRRELRPLDTAARALGATSWIILCIPLIQTAIQLSYGDGGNGKQLIGLHTSIGVLALTGAVTEFLANILFIGATMTLEWIATDFNLDFWANYDDPPENTKVGMDGIGWRSLEVTYMAIHGFLLWIDAAEWLFLAVILFLLFLSIQRQPQHENYTGPSLSLAFGGFGLFLSLICIIEFCTEVLRFKSWKTFSKIAFGISVLSRVFIWPVWYLWLGYHLATNHAKSFGAALQQHRQRQQPNDTEMISYPDIFGSTASSTTAKPSLAATSVALNEKEAVLT